METITVKKPSVVVMRKLYKGQQATLTKGDDFEILVPPMIANKIKKAHEKGKGIRVKLEPDSISEMEGKGAWSWIKRTTARITRGIAEPVAKIGGEVVKLATGSKQAGKAVETTGRFLLGKDELSTFAGGLGGLGGAELGTAAALAVGQPELAPIGALVGGVIGSAVAKSATKRLEKATRPNRKTPEAGKKPDKEKKQTEKEAEKQRKQQEKEVERQRKQQEREMRKQAMKPYANRDTSGRLKTFKTLTGATPDPVPVETMFQGTGKPKKGSIEMKEKMAKLRALKKKVQVIEKDHEKMSGEGLIAEGKGLIAEGKGMEIMEGTGKHIEKGDERLDIKISEIAKKVAVIEKEHAKMIGKGKHTQTFTTIPVENVEPRPILGSDPATYSPVVSVPRPDVDKGHNIPFRSSRYDGISGSKLLGRRHQGFSSQAHSVNYNWKHTLGLPK